MKLKFITASVVPSSLETNETKQKKEKKKKKSLELPTRIFGSRRLSHLEELKKCLSGKMLRVEDSCRRALRRSKWKSSAAGGRVDVDQFPAGDFGSEGRPNYFSVYNTERELNAYASISRGRFWRSFRSDTSLGAFTPSPKDNDRQIRHDYDYNDDDDDDSPTRPTRGRRRTETGHSFTKGGGCVGDKYFNESFERQETILEKLSDSLSSWNEIIFRENSHNTIPVSFLPLDQSCGTVGTGGVLLPKEPIGRNSFYSDVSSFDSYSQSSSDFSSSEEDEECADEMTTQSSSEVYFSHDFATDLVEDDLTLPEKIERTVVVETLKASPSQGRKMVDDFNEPMTIVSRFNQPSESVDIRNNRSNDPRGAGWNEDQLNRSPVSNNPTNQFKSQGHISSAKNKLFLRLYLSKIRLRQSTMSRGRMKPDVLRRLETYSCDHWRHFQVRATSSLRRTCSSKRSHKGTPCKVKKETFYRPVSLSRRREAVS